MKLSRKTDWPSLLTGGSWLSDFFDGDRYFDAEWLRRVTVPAVNVKETDNGFEIELAAPGMTKKDFNITVDNHVMTISSEKKEEKKEEKDTDYTRREFSYSSFSRSFTLPENVVEDDIKATYEEGILKLNMGKKVFGPSKVRKAIEVH